MMFYTLYNEVIYDPALIVPCSEVSCILICMHYIHHNDQNTRWFCIFYHTATLVLWISTSGIFK